MFKNILKFSLIFTAIFSTFLLLFIVSVNVPKNITSFIGSHIGFADSVSNSAHVESNKYSNLAMQLKMKESRLQDKEEELSQIEGDLVQKTSLRYNRFFLTSVVLLLFLVFLVIFNFYKDHKRISHLVEIEHDLKEELEDIEKLYRKSF